MMVETGIIMSDIWFYSYLVYVCGDDGFGSPLDHS